MTGMTGDIQTLKSIGPQGDPGTPGAITDVSGDVATRVAVFSGTGALIGYALFVYNDATKTLTLGAATNITVPVGNFTSYAKTTAVAVAALPVAATAGAGARAFVTDALLPAFGVAVADGGAVKVPVYSDGAAWIVG